MKYRRIKLGQIGNSETVNFAVHELTRYWKKMDPALFVDIFETDCYIPDFQNIIWVGIDPFFARDVPAVKDPALDDAISISISENAGFITGSNERSVLIAVYRLLKEQGCAWVRPGLAGERIPSKKIESVNVTVREAASYRHRAVCIEGCNTYDNVLETVDYLPKIALNGYYVQFLVPSAFFTRWYDHGSNPYMDPEPISRQEILAMVKSLEREISKRGIIYQKVGHGWTCEPLGIEGNGWTADGVYHITDEIRQYFALVNGKRELQGNVPLTTDLCYSNPAVRNIMTDAVTKYCKDNPQVTALSFSLADGSNTHCECENCVKKIPSDWYVTILNELDKKLTAANLPTKIVFCLYVDLLWAPQTERIQNPDRFILLFAPITRNYGQSYGKSLQFDGELQPFHLNHLIIPETLEENLAHLRNWQEQFTGDSYCFDYHLMWAHIADPGYEKCARSLFQDMADLHKIGLNGMTSCQVQRSFFPTGLPIHMMAAALWDESCDFDTIADQYYMDAFGTDGPWVRSYLRQISDLMLVYEKPVLGHIHGPFCKDYRALEKLIADSDAVIAEHAQQNSVYQNNWLLLKVHREYTCLMAKCFEKLELTGIESCKEQAQELVDFINRNELTLQRVMDGHNTLRTLKGRFGLGTFGVNAE